MEEKTSQAWIDIYASRQTGKILTGTLAAIEKYQTSNQTSDCAILYYGDEVKVIIPVQEMNLSVEDRAVIRSMIGAEIDFIVKGIDRENEIAVGSRKEAMKLRKELELNKHKAGDKVLVRVLSIGSNYAYVELYGVEVKLMKEDIAYGYVDNIRNYIQTGDKVQVLIKELDIENNKIKLSMKELTKDPYENIETRYKQFSEYLGTIVSIKEYGIFVCIEKGIYTLCDHPYWAGYTPMVGDKVLIRIDKINVAERKIKSKLLRVVKKVINQ